MKQLWQIKNIQSVFSTNRFDLRDYQDAIKAVPGLEQANEEAADLGGQPAQDAFLDLYKARTQFADPAAPALKALKSLIEKGRQTPEWERLKSNSTGDIVSSAVGAEVYVNHLLRSLPEDVKDQAKKHAQAQAQADELKARAEMLQEFADLMAEKAAGTEPGDMQQEYQQQAEASALDAKEHQQMAQEWQAKAAAAGLDLDEALEKNDAQIQAALNNAAAQATGQAQETSSLVRGFSLAAGGDGTVSDPSQVAGIRELLKQQPNLRDLAEMLGWARQMARAEWRKSTRGNVELTGYKPQHLQPGRMASGEMAKMVSKTPAIRQDWQRRAADNAIVHRQYEGENPEGRGDLILVRDESGSMAGQKHSLAVALEWALLDIARRDKRQFTSIPFSGPGDMSVWKAPDRPDLPGLLAHLGHFYGGGTFPYPALEAALDELADSDQKADILVLTDDQFGTPPETFTRKLKDAKSKRPLKIVTVVIGGSGHMAEQFSDKVISIKDLIAGREQLREAVAGVV